MPKSRRHRKIRSCNICRQRKLRCDRIWPVCGRCERNGKPQDCIWLQDADLPSTVDAARTESAQDTAPPQHQKPNSLTSDVNSGMVAKLEALTNKVAELEAALGPQASGSLQTRPLASRSFIYLTSEDYADNHPNGQHTHFLRGESFRTRYNGSTHPSLLVALVPGFSSFMREATREFQLIENIRQSVHKTEAQIANTRLTNQPNGMLQALIPPKSTADQLVQAYLDSFDHIYHILYLPTFKLQYAELWTDEASALADEKFLVIVLLIIATAMCLTSTTAGEYCEDRFSSRNEATSIIHSCEDWLHQQIPKHSDLPDFQIQFLLLFARQLNARRFKQTWVNAGKVVRSFMCAGLHMEPSEVHVESPVHRELRRRLWVSAAEFELQAAFEHGMPGTGWPLQSNIDPPKNVFDDDLETCSISRSALEFTQSSFVATAHQSIWFRHSLNTLLNNVRATISFDETKVLTERLNYYLTSVPLWTDGEAAVPKALLFIDLHQYQLALHIRQIHRATTPTQKSFSLKVLLDTAKDMISLYTAIPEARRGALELLSSDHIRAALALCFTWVTPITQVESVMNIPSETDVLQLMQEVIALVTSKFSHFGGDQRQLWIATAATAFIKTHTQPWDRERFICEAVSAFTAPFGRLRSSCSEQLMPNTRQTETRDETLGQLSSTSQDFDAFEFANMNLDDLWDFSSALPAWD